MAEYIDVAISGSGVLRREMILAQAGDHILEMLVRTANGRLTAAEVLGHRQFVLTKLYRTREIYLGSISRRRKWSSNG